MTLLGQSSPDLRDVFTVVNTVVLVVNVVLILYIKGQFTPIHEKIQTLKAIVDGNVLSIQDIRENFLRKSRVDEDFRQLDTDIKARFDKLEKKMDCCDSKIGDCRTSIAALRASLGHDGAVGT